MNYVYRYIDTKDSVVLFVGFVCRDGVDTLSRRIYEHKVNDVWCHGKSWKIEYITVKTKNDAHALESHFIALYGTDKWFNRKKINEGILSYYKEEPEWVVFDENLCVEPRNVKKRSNFLLPISIEKLPDLIAENMANIVSSISVVDDMLENEDYSMFPREQLIADKQELENLKQSCLNLLSKKELLLA